MNKYAAYAGESWLFDLHADSDLQALRDAKAIDSAVTHVERISTTGTGGRAA